MARSEHGWIVKCTGCENQEKSWKACNVFAQDDFYELGWKGLMVYSHGLYHGVCPVCDKKRKGENDETISKTVISSGSDR